MRFKLRTVRWTEYLAPKGGDKCIQNMFENLKVEHQRRSWYRSNKISPKILVVDWIQVAQEGYRGGFLCDVSIPLISMEAGDFLTNLAIINFSTSILFLEVSHGY
jgi:hypothetical protein